MDDILDNINEGVLGWKNKANLMNEVNFIKLEIRWKALKNGYSLKSSWQNKYWISQIK